MENIVKKLGGVHRFANDNSDYERTMEFVENKMGSIPERMVVDFSLQYGNSVFNNQIVIKSNCQSIFLSDRLVELGLIFGFGSYKRNIMQIIQTYYINEQINSRFYPICEGYPGDIIYYSLEKESYGHIFYWHHEAIEELDRFLISDSFYNFLNGLFVEKNKDTLLDITDEELIRINKRRVRVGLPLIDKNGNVI